MDQNNNIPSNLDEAIDILVNEFIASSSETISKILDEDTETFQIHEHFNTGLHIRNAWNLWDNKSPLVKWFNNKGIYHGDDISSLIIKAFHSRIRNNSNFDFNKEIQYYIKYWEKHNPNINKGIF